MPRYAQGAAYAVAGDLLPRAAAMADPPPGSAEDAQARRGGRAACSVTLLDYGILE